MRVMSVCVLFSSAAILGFGFFLVQYAVKSKLIEKQHKETRPPCVRLFPQLIDIIGKLTVVSAVLAVPAYFGGKFGDQGSMLILLSIVALLNLLMIFDLVNLNTFVDKQLQEKNSKALMKNVTKNYYHDNSTVPQEEIQIVRKKINSIQALNHCCGSDGPGGWTANEVAVPESCCYVAADCDTALRSNVYKGGCYRFWREMFKKGRYSEKKDENKPSIDEGKVLTRNLSLLALLAMVHYITIFLGRIWPEKPDLDPTVATVLRR